MALSPRAARTRQKRKPGQRPAKVLWGSCWETGIAPAGASPECEADHLQPLLQPLVQPLVQALVLQPLVQALVQALVQPLLQPPHRTWAQGKKAARHRNPPWARGTQPVPSPAAKVAVAGQRPPFLPQRLLYLSPQAVLHQLPPQAVLLELAGQRPPVLLLRQLAGQRPPRSSCWKRSAWRWRAWKERPGTVPGG